MKTTIYYFSGSGNTTLAVSSLAASLRHTDVHLVDISSCPAELRIDSDLVGIACYADFGAPSEMVYRFLRTIQLTPPVYAFVFVTYGFAAGATLSTLYNMTREAGFCTIGGHALHMPESYPPMRKMGLSSDYAPRKKDIRKFTLFVDFLQEQVDAIASNAIPVCKPQGFNFIHQLLPVLSRRKAKNAMGIQQVDVEKCSKCGLCEKQCPYHAIELKDLPVFDHDKCHGCWVCYNHCVSGAIQTSGYTGKHQYPRPTEHARNVFGPAGSSRPV